MACGAHPLKRNMLLDGGLENGSQLSHSGVQVGGSRDVSEDRKGGLNLGLEGVTKFVPMDVVPIKAGLCRSVWDEADSVGQSGVVRVEVDGREYSPIRY